VDPFYKTVWFRLLAAALVAVGAYVGLRWIAFQRYKNRLRQVVKREALSMERQRIAMDVHDDLGADMSNLLLRIRMALDNGTDPRAALQNVEQTMAGMMRKIDEIIWSLDPRMDSLKSTSAFIEQQAAVMVNNVGLAFRSSSTPVGMDRRVTASFRRDLYLLVKEALNNVFKHAQANEVHLRITIDDDRLHVLVEDDGRGIHYRTRPTDRHGTSNMQRRGVKVKGDVRITPLDPGTRCEIIVPLPQNHP
jgi:signal transduction histidine kinase